jgi:SAM-dependent methyltransferase
MRPVKNGGITTSRGLYQIFQPGCTSCVNLIKLQSEDMNLFVDEMVIPADDHLWLGETLVEEYVDNIMCDGCGSEMVPIAKILNKNLEVGLETGLCLRCGYIKRTRNLSAERLTHHFSKKWLHRRDEEVKEEVDVFSKVKKFIPLEGRVLDVGCGLGGNLLAFKNSGYDVFGIDPSEHRVGIGSKLMDGIKVGFAEDYLKDPAIAKFDLIYFFNVLQFLENPFEALCLAVKKLKDTGLLYFRSGVFQKSSNFCLFSHLLLQRNFLSINSILNKLSDWDLRIIYYRAEPMEVILAKKSSGAADATVCASILSMREIESHAKRTLKYNSLRLLGKANLNYKGRKTSLILKRPIYETLPFCFIHKTDKLPVLFK